MRRNPLFAACILLAIFATSCGRDEGIDPDSVAEYEDYLADEMDRQHIPAMSVLLFRGNTVLYERCLGLADRENSTSLTPDHMFLLASVSKTITATAVMQLKEDGLLALDNPVNDYLAWDVRHPDSDVAITVRHLLTHTSGIIDSDALDGQYYYGADSPVALQDFLQRYLVPGGQDYDAGQNFARFEPGEGYEYSNTGSALLGAVVEAVSGMDFNDYCKARIFQPMGMAHTFWHLGETDTAMVVRPYAYRRGEHAPLQHYTFTDYPNGGLRSTALDLYVFCSAYADGGAFNGNQLLQAATVAEMLQLQVEDLDETQGLSFYQIGKDEGLWGHEGGEQGVSTVVAFNPVDHTGVIVLTNATDAEVEGMALSGYRLAGKL